MFLFEVKMFTWLSNHRLYEILCNQKVQFTSESSECSAYYGYDEIQDQDVFHSTVMYQLSMTYKWAC